MRVAVPRSKETREAMSGDLLAAGLAGQVEVALHRVDAEHAEAEVRRQPEGVGALAAADVDDPAVGRGGRARAPPGAAPTGPRGDRLSSRRAANASSMRG